MESSLLNDRSGESDLVHLPSVGYLPIYVVSFKKSVLDSPKILKAYYVCYIGLILFSTYDFIVYFSISGSFFENGVLYELFYLLQNITLLAIVPFCISFLKETLNSNDIPNIVGIANEFDAGVILRFRFMSVVNLVGFFISLVVFFVTKKSYLSGTISVVLLLITTIPLPLCVSVVLLILESHRLVAIKFLSQLSQSKHAHITYAGNSTDENVYFRSLVEVRSEFIKIRDMFLFTSDRRGRFISSLMVVLFLLQVYLIWTTYLWTVSLLGLLGFIMLVMFIFMELFFCTALANEAGKEVTRAVAEYVLYHGSLTHQSGQYRDPTEDIIAVQLLASFNFVKIEIRGIGGIVIDLKLVSTVFFGLIASIVPRLVMNS